MYRAYFRWDLPNVIAAGFCKLLGDLIGFLGPLSLSGIVNFVALRAKGVDDVMLWGMQLGACACVLGVAFPAH
jgi:hypothetical protein